MLNLKRKTVMEPTSTITDQFPIPYPQSTATLPDNPMSYGKDVNIVAIVREHAPKRIEAIQREVTKLDEQRARLLEEQAQLTRLVDALHA